MDIFHRRQQPAGHGFPRYHDGDVFITITRTYMYQLHARTLRRWSSIFKRLLIDNTPVGLPRKRKCDHGPVRYRIDFTSGGGDWAGSFVRRQARRGSDRAILPEIDNDIVPATVYKHYDNLFRAIYGLIPVLEDSSSDSLIEDCNGLLDVAELHDASAKIAMMIELVLRQPTGQLYEAVASNPAPWSELGLRLRSSTILKDAVIHLVGDWPSLSEQARNGLKDEIRSLCQRKYDELHDRKRTLEVGIAAYYPGMLQRQPEINPGPSSDGSDIYVWMAIAIFRHWFTQAICEGRGRQAKDGGASLYRTLAAAGVDYLDRDDIDQFRSVFPMTDEGAACLDAALFNVKEGVKSMVAEFIEDRTLITPKRKQMPYLTCCEVTREDLPWKQQANQPAEAPVDKVQDEEAQSNGLG